jgi:DNA replication and repair protein RecF
MSKDEEVFLKELHLKNFRNFKDASIAFCPGVNLFEGNNAQGKTNLLEAIFLLNTGRSFRTRMLKELIAHDACLFRIEACVIKGGVDQTLKIAFDGSSKQLEINATTYTSFTPLLGLLPHVLYAPEDIFFVIGAPQERRRFFDLYLSQIDPLYLYHLTRFYAAMKQRNALLKREREETMEHWEEVMAASSEVLIQKRTEIVSHLNPLLREAMQKLSNRKDVLSLSYRSSLSSESSFLAQLQHVRAKEKESGYTLIGPHRDDFILSVNEQSAKMFASQGQKRCAIVALRFAQWQQQLSATGYPPLLSIDDFGLHLDLERHFLLQQQLEGKGQVFITAPHFQQQMFPSAHVQRYHIEQGQICLKK